VKNLTDFYERGGGSITGPTFFAEMKWRYLGDANLS
jgi:hypothetical protein